MIMKCYYRYIVASEIINHIGMSRALALPGFHAFTGSDTTSSFMNHGKATAWKVWNSYPAVTQVFQKLSGPIENSDELLLFMPILETFVNKIFFGVSKDCSSVDEARLDAIIYKSKDFSHIPPSSDALFP